ncbi:serine/threonine-protein kinase [Corallococcus macrosporus]|uniref:Serine/threonine kinase PKN11 n=1 Tax=Myxococcus fulvus (strain ATCC BAA-855 / HW-1) TaxID=483219 RepID=F8CIU1_MYXFH|nr:serine/threonine-protein kinase [Corallococcus macrosporus]AEI66357.1 serine/threonine kinase PKN11 [Corallococcus macrosporus]
MTLEAGTHIGKYIVRRKLAEGGMAEIYLCTARGAEGFEKEVVIKRVRAFLASDPEFVGMFIAEARLASRLNHANVVQIFDFDKHEDTYYLAMEYVRGCSLWELRKRGKELMEPVPPMLVAHIGAEVARGLHYAHRVRVNGQPLDLVHRDVTPHNVLLSFDGAVKLTDFGIAKAGNKLTQPGVLKGKFAYMSPEQARGEAVDARTDIFALGVVLWEMLTGGRLFDGDSEVAVLRAVQQSAIPPPARLNPDVPADLDAAVVRALERDPALRFQTAAELERALAQCVLTHARSVDDTDLSAFMRRLFPTSLTQAIPTVQERTHVVEGEPAPGAGPGPVPREPTAVMAPHGRSGLALPTSPDEDVNAPTFVLPRRGEEAALDAAPLPPMATPMMPLPAVASSPVPRGVASDGGSPAQVPGASSEEGSAAPGRQQRAEGVALAAPTDERSSARGQQGHSAGAGAGASGDERSSAPGGQGRSEGMPSGAPLDGTSSGSGMRSVPGEASRSGRTPSRGAGVPSVAGAAGTPSRPEGLAAVAPSPGASGSLGLASAWDDEDDDEGTASTTEPEALPAGGASWPGHAEVAAPRASGPVASVGVPPSGKPWALGLSVALGLTVIGGGVALMRGRDATPPPTAQAAQAAPEVPEVPAPVVAEAPAPVPSGGVEAARDAGVAPAEAPQDAEAEVDGVLREEVLAAATSPSPAAEAPEPEATRAAPSNGTLQVQAAPYATVFINGKRMGEVTGRATYRLPAGAHKLVFQHPSGERRYDVTVTAGGTVSREFRAPRAR